MQQKSDFVLVLVLAVTAALASVTSLEAQEESQAETAVVDEQMWASDTTGPVPWAEAEEFCETLETEGFTDWRLPTLSELEALHDPTATGGIRLPFELEDCCAWSSVNLVELEAALKGNLPEPAGPPAGYYWGFLFDGGIAYYSNGAFPDGLALCVRDQ